jgi:hypothetical protein
MIREHNAWAFGADRDLGHSRAHRLDREDDTRPEHVPVEVEVGLDVPARTRLSLPRGLYDPQSGTAVMEWS